MKLAQAGFGDKFLAETRASKFEGKTKTTIKRCFDKIFLQYRTKQI